MENDAQDDMEDILPNDDSAATKDDHAKIPYGENASEDGDITTLDDDIGLSTQSLPSSMGLTFFIVKDIDSLCSPDFRYLSKKAVTRLLFAVYTGLRRLPHSFTF
jgi:hypothetical protein